MSIDHEESQNKNPLRWFFPDLQHADSEGLNDPLLQYFSGDHNWYIAREVIQNSVDARKDDEKPVVVKFEKIILPTIEVPGITELKPHLEACLAQARTEGNGKAERYYEDAVKATSNKQTVVLRVSDFNTSGLTGADRDKKGKWHRLVKAVGENQVSGVGGGSYGIGKGAPYVASRVRTVYYSTRNESGDVIFQGKSRLMSHELGGTEYRGVGSFGVSGYESVRDPELIPKSFLRAEQGTDINIIGYDVSLVWVDEIAASVLNNFWMAIYSGSLEVVITEGLKEIRMDRSNLRELLEKYCKKDGFIFYRTVVEPTRTFEKQLPILGSCHLYIKIEEKFPRKLSMMRRPKMHVEEWRFQKTLQDPYAGVFVCDDPEGNLILRGLEPPEHDKWNPSLDPSNGKEALDEIRDWVRGNLLELAAEESGDPEEIPGLDKFLPYDDDSEKFSESSRIKTNPSGFVTPEESALEVGAEREEREDEIEEFIKKPSSKKDSGGAGKNQRNGTTKGEGGGPNEKETGTGDVEGDAGASLIDTSSVNFRIIHAGNSKAGNAEYCLVLEPLVDQRGGLNIVSLGEDATVYPEYLAYANDWENSEKKYEHRGSFIGGLTLVKGSKLRVRFATKSNSRHALGIENHEN
jgi:hypothetical protein